MITKINENRDKPGLFTNQQAVYPKKHLRQKLSDKFHDPTKITSTNKDRKTVQTESHQKVHMDNLKRPLRNKYSF